MKKPLCLFLSLLLCISFTVPVSAKEPILSARAYVLYCPDNGRIILSQNADQQLPIASTTKIMTTLLTLEEADADNRVVEFTDEMIAEGSSMYLKRGEKVTLYDLAVGMMMQSGNDAANAAAIAIAGSIEAFAERMNEKAAQIGMTHTHFVTPSGLDDEAHYSTASDMALLMAYAMEHPDFRFITAQTSMEVHFIYPADKFMTYPNHNKLLKRYKDCIGGKTGFTDKAGRCLVTAARRDGLTLIAVTLDDGDDWKDHAALYDYGFSSYQAISLCDNCDQLDVVGGERDVVALYTDEQRLIVPKSADPVDQQVFLLPFVYAPVEEDTVVGKIVCLSNGKTVKEIMIRAAEAVAYRRR